MKVLAATLLSVTLAACAIEATRTGTLEIWNRTEAPIRVVGRDASFEIPACGHAAEEHFVLNRYDIVDDQGRFVVLQGGGGWDPAHPDVAYEVIPAAAVDFYMGSTPPPEPLPPCSGVLQGQPTATPS